MYHSRGADRMTNCKNSKTDLSVLVFEKVNWIELAYSRSKDFVIPENTE
jgi:hypothetical protein